MKKITALLLFALSMAALPAMAQSEDEVAMSFAFVNENYEVFENGATVIRNVVEPYGDASEVINSGLSVIRLSGEQSDNLKMIYTIERIDNGTFQLCFPITCNTQSKVGRYETSAGPLNGDLQDLQSEWFPVADGECIVSYTIEIMTPGFPRPFHKAWGPTITVRFVKGDLPPEPIKGDVNGDGEVTVSDINYVINCILLSTFNKQADVNNDDEITVSDINAIVEIILNH